MDYVDKQIGGLVWKVLKIVEGSMPDVPLRSPQFRPTLTDRGNLQYFEQIFPDGLFTMCGGKTVVDICSGGGNLDHIAEAAEQLIRVDALYRNRPIVQRLLSTSQYPEKYRYVPSSAFFVRLPAGLADLTIENYGTLYYQPHILLGPALRTIGARNLSFEECLTALSPNLARRVQQRIYLSCKSIGEMIRITKPGGRIIAGPISTTTEPLYSLTLAPALRQFEETKIIRSVEFASRLDAPTRDYKPLKNLVINR